MKKILIYKGVSYPIEILGAKERELMKKEIEKQFPEEVEKKLIEPVKKAYKKHEDD